MTVNSTREFLKVVLEKSWIPYSEIVEFRKGNNKSVKPMNVHEKICLNRFIRKNSR